MIMVSRFLNLSKTKDLQLESIVQKKINDLKRIVDVRHWATLLTTFSFVQSFKIFQEKKRKRKNSFKNPRSSIVQKCTEICMYDD